MNKLANKNYLKDISADIVKYPMQIRSSIYTTNLTFDRWEEIFKDPILTTAIIDRLAYKAHIIDLSGESYRAQETLKWLNEK